MTRQSLKASEPAVPESPPVPDVNAPSEELQVIQPAADEPVRRGGWVLTENGWELDHPGSEPEHEPEQQPGPEDEKE